MTMQMSRKLMIGGGALMMAAIGLTACSGGQRPQAQAAQVATPAQTPTVIVTTVESRELNRQVRLPGELQAYQDTAIYAKVPGFVEVINVDRGSVVRQGQLLARLRAPELDTQRGEAEAKVRAAQSQRVEAQSKVSGIRAQRLEAEAKLAADEATFQRMKAASATPGVVAGNDLEIAQRAVEAGRARIQLWNENEKAAQAQVKALEENEGALREAARSSQNIGEYLRITAPFDGVVQRVSNALDEKTRTMPVELDVSNPNRRLAPGMVPEVVWPVSRPRPSMFVPSSAVATTTERAFVIRIRDGVTEWVDVKRGASMSENGKDLVEVFGDLSPGDQIAVRGTDELRAGTRVNAKPAAANK